MIRWSRQFACVCSAALVLISCAQPEAEPVRAVARVQAELVQALDDTDSADVIVSLREPAVDRVLAKLPSSFKLSHRYRRVPGFAGTVTRAGLDALMADPAVLHVHLDRGGSGQLKEAVAAVGADKVHSIYNLTGRGVRVAVLDTGVDLEHPDLRGSVVAQHCFTRNGCAPWNTAEGTNAQDDHGHGTLVAGIIASRGMLSAPGFAPGAEIVAVKVMGSDNRGRESDWIAGIDWIHSNLSTLKVNVVNVSLGTDQLYASAEDCDRREPLFAAAVRALVSEGVAVFAAAGNHGSTTVLPAPACNAGSISVGASYDSDSAAQPPDGMSYADRFGPGFRDCRDAPVMVDQIACFNNVVPRLDLIAPGAPVIAPWLGGETRPAWGTSQAAAAASGVAALMLQCNPTIKPEELRLRLINTGKPQTDPTTKATFPVVRALAAVQSACPTLDAGMPAAAGAPAAEGGKGGGTAGAAAGAPSAGQQAPIAGETSRPMPRGGAGNAAPPRGGTTAVGQSDVDAGAAEPADAGAQPNIIPFEEPKRKQGSLANTQQDSSGCGCRTVPAPRSNAGWLLGMWLVVFAQARARKRARHQPVVAGTPDPKSRRA